MSDTASPDVSRDLDPPSMDASEGGHAPNVAKAGQVAQQVAQQPNVETALAGALAAAAAAGQWDVVAALAKELEARRLAGAG